MKRNKTVPPILSLALAFFAVQAAEQPPVMFGHGPSRNMISDEKGLPTKWDPATGLNIKWKLDLGSQTYAGPVVHGGKVFVGTNNQREYNPLLKGDRGNVMAVDAESGKLIWQSAHAKLGAGRVNDWPLQGVCSTPYVVGDRVYYVSNRAEVICADAEGFTDGENDGPFKDELAAYPKPPAPVEGQPAPPAPKLSDIDEDIVWKFDLIGELDAFPHNLAAGSPLIAEGILFTVTGHGVDEGHTNIPSPLGPSFVALDAKTGELIWESADPGENILHGTWSNPSYGVIGGKPQVIFPGGDGWLYSYVPRTGELIWKFNLNPEGTRWELGGRGTKNNVISMPVIHGDRVYIGVGQDPEHGEGPGNFWVIDGTGSGDITKTGVVWHRGGEDFHRTLSSASIADGLLYVADLSGFLYCLDLETGELYWKHDTFAAIWGSSWVADGKVYLGDEDGDIVVLEHGKKEKVLHEVNMGAAVYTTPVAKDGVIYVASRTTLFAIAEPKAAPPQPDAPATGKSSD